MLRLDNDISSDDSLGWALPRKLWELPEELAIADIFLNDVHLLEPLAGCLNLEHGRPSLPVAQVLRLFYLKEQYRLSDGVLIREVSDSIHWRRFCHFGLADEVPNSSSLSKWRHRLGADGIRRVNRAITLKLHEEKKVVRGRKIRVDSTVVDADIHYPTDSGLIADGVKRLTRLGKQVKAAIEGTVTEVHDRSRSVKKRLLGIGKLLRRRSGDAVQEVRKVTEELAKLGEKQGRAVMRLSEEAQDRLTRLRGKARRRAERLLHKASEMQHLLEAVIDQSRKVTAGEKHIKERIVSLSDPDARPIKKGKLGQTVQFGYKIGLVEGEKGFVTDYTTEHGNPRDTDALVPALDRHHSMFGSYPDTLAADRGFSSFSNEEECKKRGIRVIAIPRPGRRSEARTAEEHSRSFRRANRWRSGIEARISVLKRMYGMRRSRYRGHDRVAMGVGLSIFAHNTCRWVRMTRAA
jgi:IS5 family transposase